MNRKHDFDPGLWSVDRIVKAVDRMVNLLRSILWSVDQIRKSFNWKACERNGPSFWSVDWKMDQSTECAWAWVSQPSGPERANLLLGRQILCISQPIGLLLLQRLVFIFLSSTRNNYSFKPFEHEGLEALLQIKHLQKSFRVILERART